LKLYNITRIISPYLIIDLENLGKPLAKKIGLILHLIYKVDFLFFLDIAGIFYLQLNIYAKIKFLWHKKSILSG
jgi:hypothetical protein